MNLTTNSTEMTKILREFLETQNLPRRHHKEIENLSRPIASKEIESIIKNFPTMENPGPAGLTGKFN